MSLAGAGHGENNSRRRGRGGSRSWAFPAEGCSTARLAVLRGAPPALLARALATAFGMVADGEHDLYYPHVNAMCELVATGSVGDSIDLPRGVRAWLTYECLIVDQAEETDVGLSSEGASREHGDWGADYRGGDAAACASLRFQA